MKFDSVVDSTPAPTCQTPPTGSRRLSLSGRLPTDARLLLTCWFQSSRPDHSASFGDLSRDEAVDEFSAIDFAAERAHCHGQLQAGIEPWPFSFGINAADGTCVQIIGDQASDRFALVVERAIEERRFGFLRRTRTERRCHDGLDATTVRAAIKTAYDSVDALFR